MTSTADQILRDLQAVAAERSARAADAALARSADAVKRYQHARFGVTYADLMAQPRYAAAAEFFLTDLYGPADFSDRDDQFGRIVPALVRLFPEHIVDTVAQLAELHALSERLDTAMARQRIASGVTGPAIGGADYGAWWRAVGEPPSRDRQIGLMVSVGQALDRYTRNRLLRQSLRLMRGPAAAAGLGALQGFLERGFDTFRDMAGAEVFLSTIALRERSLAAQLFAGGDAPDLP
ncbi:MAG: FFLEELY motif protein [Betaproteobacteria bacterium]